jgi:hypothetical protein
MPPIVPISQLIYQNKQMMMMMMMMMINTWSTFPNCSFLKLTFLAPLHFQLVPLETYFFSLVENFKIGAYLSICVGLGSLSRVGGYVQSNTASTHPIFQIC